MSMSKMEATLHFGMTRDERPSAEAIRSMFFASVLSAAMDDVDTQKLSLLLHDTYVAALQLENEEEGGPIIELNGMLKAIDVYREAFAESYCSGKELPEGVGWWEHLKHDSELMWYLPLIRDLGLLLGYYQKAYDVQFNREMRRLQKEQKADVKSDS